MAPFPKLPQLTEMIRAHVGCCIDVENGKVRPGAEAPLAQALIIMAHQRIDLPNIIDADHIQHQRLWSEKTFGPGGRVAGVIDHLHKEVKEAADNPDDVSEWADIIILAIDGAWRAGHGAQTIVDAVVSKQLENEGREWPDWRKQPRDKAIEHIKPELSALGEIPWDPS